MDDDSQQSDDGHITNSLLRLSDHHEARCVVCRCYFSLENESNEGFDAISICHECKNIVLEDSDAGILTRDFGRRRSHRRRGNGFGSTESIEDLFSNQFSHLVNLVRQTRESLNEGETVTSRHRHSHYTYRRRSRRWRTSSDNDSDGVDYVDSLPGESDSIISFSGYGGESEASFDSYSFRDREIFVHLDNESQAFSDTDIDPMHVGLDQWNSYDQDEEEGEWEEADIDEEVVAEVLVPRRGDGSPLESNSAGFLQNGNTVNWEMGGNSTGFLDPRSFTELLEQLADAEGSRRSTPLATTSPVLVSLPYVTISKEQEDGGSLLCAVCMDTLAVNTEAKQMPCLHLYHPNCILPWLKSRKSCPVCRYELPVNDHEYEAKRNSARPRNRETRMQIESGGSPSNVDSAPVDVGRSLTNTNVGGGGGRWIFLVAAPIVAIVGSVLVMWLQNPSVNVRAQHIGPECSYRSLATVSCRRSRRWIFF